MTISPRSLLFGGLLMGVLWHAHPALCQKISSLSTVGEIEKRNVYVFPLKNIAPNLIVSWLGRSYPKTQELTRATPTYVTLIPEGIENMVADDAKNELLVFGTQKGVQQLWDSIRNLDRPLPQIEIETHVLWLKPKEIEGLGLKFGPPEIYRRASHIRYKNDYIGIKESRGESGADLTALLTAHGFGEKIARTPLTRRLFINNLTGLIPIPVSPSTNAFLKPPTNEADIIASEVTPLSVTPTLNHDDTITFSLQTNDFTILEPPGAPITSGATQIILHIGDNKTRALWFSDYQKLNTGNANNDEELIEMIVFITPHIVKPIPLLQR